MHRVVFLALIVLVSPIARPETGNHLLLQKPALSRTHIVFSYAGDLWSVPRGRRCHAAHHGRGHRDRPVFSPDGSHIAFTGEYDGNVDVFVMPASGGMPRRLT